jgi:hypothetical protein
MKTTSYRPYIVIIAISITLMGLGVFYTILKVRQTHYVFTAKLPDTKTMNVTRNVPFDDVSTRSLVTMSACISNQVVPQGEYEPAYIDGRLVAIHIIASTQIFDQRERKEPVLVDANMLKQGQEIEVWTTELPTFEGNAVAKKIIIHADGVPEPCEPYWVKNLRNHP